MAWARKSAGGGNVRSSRRRSAISGFGLSSAMAGRISYDPHAPRTAARRRLAGPECDEPRTHLSGELLVRHAAELEEGAIVLDRRRGVAAFVGDNGKVVVGAGVVRL